MHTIDTKEDPFSPDAKALVRVVIVLVGQMFKASYELRDDAGNLVMQRQLPEHGDCATAVVSVGLSVGLFMPQLLTAPPPPPPEPPPPRPHPDPPPLPDPPLLPPPDPPPPPLPAKPPPPNSLRVDAGVLLSMGSAPEPAGGYSFHLGASHAWPRLWGVSLSVGYRQEFPRSMEIGPNRLSAWRKLLEVVPCGHVNLTPGRIGPFVGVFGCGLLQLGELSVRSQTPNELATENYLNVSGGTRSGLDVTVSKFPELTVFVAWDITVRKQTGRVWPDELRIGTRRAFARATRRRGPLGGPCGASCRPSWPRFAVRTHTSGAARCPGGRDGGDGDALWRRRLEPEVRLLAVGMARGRVWQRRGPRAEMGEDLANHRGLGDRREHAHLPSAPGAEQNIEPEGPCHPHGAVEAPRPGEELAIVEAAPGSDAEHRGLDEHPRLGANHGDGEPCERERRRGRSREPRRGRRSEWRGRRGRHRERRCRR